MQVNYNTLNKLHLRSNHWYRQKQDMRAQQLSGQAWKLVCVLGHWYNC